MKTGKIVTIQRHPIRGAFGAFARIFRAEKRVRGRKSPSRSDLECDFRRVSVQNPPGSEQIRKIKKIFNRKPGHFFLAYFTVITVILLWNLTHCTESSWIAENAFATDGSYSAAGQGDGDPVELKDDAPLVVRAAAGQDGAESPANMFGRKPRLRGVALLGYGNTRSLLFSGETVSAGIVSIETGETVGSGTLLLKNQTPYPNDETEIYIALSEPVTQMLPEETEVHFSTSGLTRSGIFIGGAAADEGEETPLARLYYEKKRWNPAMPFLYYIAEVLAGLGCLLLYGEGKLPLLRSGRTDRLAKEGSPVSYEPENRGAAGGTAARPYVRKLIPPALILLFAASLMLYTYLHVIRETAAACDGDFLTGGSRTEDVISLEPGVTLRQSMTVRQDSLSGIGIRLVQENGKSIASPETVEYADSALEWKLLDETGTAMLTSGSTQVKDLKRAREMFSKDITDGVLLKAADESFVLTLDEPVLEAKGKRFVLEIALAQEGITQEKVHLLATGDTNGQIETTAAGQETLPLELCLMGIYACNGFIEGMYLRLSVVVLIMLAALYYAARRFSRPGLRTGRQTAAMYLVSALCMGMVFSFMAPVYTISDERTHIDSVYTLSNRFFGIRDIPGPRRLLKRACDIDTSIANTMPVTAQRYRAVHEDLFGAAPKTGAAASAGAMNSAEENASGSTQGALPSPGRELTPAYARNVLDNVPVLCYLPAAIGFSAARLLGRNMITMVLLARWLNLLACVLIMFLAIRRMPCGAAAMAVIGLFPKTLQQMSSCSYDGMVIAGTYLFIALCLSAAFGEDPCIADLLALILTGLFVAACKGGAYLPVVGMAFLIPAARSGKGEKTRKFWRSVAGGAVGGAVLLFAGKYVARLLSMFGRESGTATIAAGTKTLYTMSDFIHSPGKLVCIYAETIAERGDGLLGELVGKNLSQKWYIVYAFLLLALLGILRRGSSRRETGDGQDRNHVRLFGRLWMLLLAAASTSLVFLSMLLAFTANDSPWIDGLQGRYFLPIALLPLLAAENGLVHREGIGDTALLYTADILLAVTFCEILLMYLGGA